MESLEKAGTVAPGKLQLQLQVRACLPWYLIVTASIGGLTGLCGGAAQVLGLDVSKNMLLVYDGTRAEVYKVGNL